MTLQSPQGRAQTVRGLLVNAARKRLPMRLEGNAEAHSSHANHWHELLSDRTIWYSGRPPPVLSEAASPEGMNCVTAYLLLCCLRYFLVQVRINVCQSIGGHCEPEPQS